MVTLILVRVQTLTSRGPRLAGVKEDHSRGPPLEGYRNLPFSSAALEQILGGRGKGRLMNTLAAPKKGKRRLMAAKKGSLPTLSPPAENEFS